MCQLIFHIRLHIYLNHVYRMRKRLFENDLSHPLFRRIDDIVGSSNCAEWLMITLIHHLWCLIWKIWMDHGIYADKANFTWGVFHILPNNRTCRHECRWSGRFFLLFASSPPFINGKLTRYQCERAHLNFLL